MGTACTVHESMKCLLINNSFYGLLDQFASDASSFVVEFKHVDYNAIPRNFPHKLSQHFSVAGCIALCLYCIKSK